MQGIFRYLKFVSIGNCGTFAVTVYLTEFDNLLP